MSCSAYQRNMQKLAGIAHRGANNNCIGIFPLFVGAKVSGAPKLLSAHAWRQEGQEVAWERGRGEAEQGQPCATFVGGDRPLCLLQCSSLSTSLTSPWQLRAPASVRFPRCPYPRTLGCSKSIALAPLTLSRLHFQRGWLSISSLTERKKIHSRGGFVNDGSFTRFSADGLFL